MNQKPKPLKGSEAKTYWTNRILHNEKGNKKQGLFKEKNKWIVFDDRQHELFTEEFETILEAIKWINE